MPAHVTQIATTDTLRIMYDSHLRAGKNPAMGFPQACANIHVFIIKKIFFVETVDSFEVC